MNIFHKRFPLLPYREGESFYPRILIQGFGNPPFRLYIVVKWILNTMLYLWDVKSFTLSYVQTEGTGDLRLQSQFSNIHGCDVRSETSEFCGVTVHGRRTNPCNKLKSYETAWIGFYTYYLCWWNIPTIFLL